METDGNLLVDPPCWSMMQLLLATHHQQEVLTLKALTSKRTARTLLNLLLAEALELVQTPLTSCTPTAFSRFSCTKEVTDLTSSHHFLHLLAKLLL